jgi:hypothetical protein
MQLDARAADGEDGVDVEEDVDERGDMCRNPPKALVMVRCMVFG